MITIKRKQHIDFLLVNIQTVIILFLILNTTAAPSLQRAKEIQRIVGKKANVATQQQSCCTLTPLCNYNTKNGHTEAIYKNLH